MTRRTESRDDGDEEPEFEGAEPEYSPEAEDAGELWCPKCGATMYADATRCPSCEEFVSPGAKPSRSHPWWIWLGLLLLLAAAAAMGLAVGR